MSDRHRIQGFKMVNVMLVLTVAVLGMIGCAESYEFASSSGCMVLYKNQHAQGASWVKKSNGDWYTWTSAECRDWCASKSDCLAVDYVGQDNSCLEHKQKFTRIPVTSASTGKSQPETVSQYAKECGNGGGYVGGPQKTRVLFLDLILTLDASSATGSSGFIKAQQFIIMLLQTYKLGGDSLRLKVVYSRGASIQVFTFDRDAETQAYIAQIQGCSYSGVNLNIELIFQRIHSFYLSFQRSGAGRCFFLMGGFSVGNSWELKTRIALYMQTISINFRFYYFAIGSQTSLYFWRDLVDEAYIIQLSSFSVTSSWTTTWFERNTNTFTVYGLRQSTKRVNLQLVLTLDGSRATGRDGYYKTFYMMLTLLRTHTLGNGNLQLYVCVHRGNQVSVVRFTSASELRSSLAILSASISYPSVSSNVVILLQKVQWVVETYFSTGRPRTVWLCGGMAVSNQQEVNLILYQLQVELKVYFYYCVMGVQTDTTYWRQALGATYVKTDFGVTATLLDRIMVSVIQIVANRSGPTVTQVIRNTSGSSSGGSSSGGSSSGGSSSGGWSSGGSSSGGSSSGSSSSGGSSSGSTQTVNVQNGRNTNIIINGQQVTVQFVVHGGKLYVSKNINPEGRCPLGTMDASTRGWCQVTNIQRFKGWTLSINVNFNFPESMIGGITNGGSSAGGSSEGSSSGGSSSGGSSSSGSSLSGSSSGGLSSGSTQTVNVQNGRNTLIINGHRITVQFTVHGGKLYVSKNINPEGRCPLGTMDASTRGWCQVTSIQSFKHWTSSFNLNLIISESMIGGSSSGSSSGGSSSGGSSSGGSSSGSSKTVNIQNGRNTLTIQGRQITVQFMVAGGKLYVSKNINPEGRCPLGTMDASTQGWCQVTGIQNFKGWASSLNLNLSFGRSIMEIFQSSSGTENHNTVLSARIVGGVTQVPAAMNIRGSGCMAGTNDVGGGYCAIYNMDAFISWAHSAGFNVERTNQNGIETIRISGSVSYTG